jgi:predicted nucleotidyltransferase
MTETGKKRVLALLLALSAPVPAVFAQTRAGGAIEGVPSVLAPAVSAPSALLPAAIPLGAAPSFSAPALNAAPAAAPVAAPEAAPAAPAEAFAARVAAPSARAVPAPAATPALRSAAVPAASDAPEGPTPPSAESEKSASDARFDGSRAASPRPAPAVRGRESSGAPALLPPTSKRSRLSPSLFDPGPRTASVPDRIRDRARYFKLLSRSFWWYMYTHIKDMWPGYKARWEKAREAGPVAVSSPRAFFTAMRVTGMSGRFYALGGSALDDDLVIAEFRRAFARYFDGPGIGAPQKEALERFMARAKGFNAEKRAHTNMYKNIRDPLLRASTMRPDELVPYFDGLLKSDKEEKTREFQRSGQMERVRKAFLKVLDRTLREEDPNDPHRVRAAIVLGSFASGSAGPNSDFDVEALVNSASNKRLAAFSDRLVAHWDAAGYHKTHPVTVHDNASWPSWGLVNIVQTRHYVVVSPEPSLVARLSRQAYESPAVTLERGYTPRGRLNRVFQRALVTTATLVSDARAAVGLPPGSGGH